MREHAKKYEKYVMTFNNITSKSRHQKVSHEIKKYVVESMFAMTSKLFGHI